MGYFANGSEGDYYEARYCARCVHQSTDARQCPVMSLHVLYNYDQQKRASTRRALSMLIPDAPNGGNGQCAMFWERGRGSGGGEPVPEPALTVAKAAALKGPRGRVG